MRYKSEEIGQIDDGYRQSLFVYKIEPKKRRILARLSNDNHLPAYHKIKEEPGDLFVEVGDKKWYLSTLIPKSPVTWSKLSNMLHQVVDANNYILTMTMEDGQKWCLYK